MHTLVTLYTFGTQSVHIEFVIIFINIFNLCYFLENDMYWEIVRLRKQMMLAKLGLALTS